MKFKRLLVENKRCTLTGFVSNSELDLFGLSTFHSLKGNDREVKDLDIVEIFNHDTNRWLKFGRTINGIYKSGSGQYGNFGKLDFAIFELKESFERRIPDRLNRLNLSNLFQFNDLSQIIGYRVKAYSEESRIWIYGYIDEMHFKDVRSRRLYDIKIKLDPGFMTFPGDSGMLWLDDFGDALGMHTDGKAYSNGDAFSFATILSRILEPNNYLIYQENDRVTT